MYFYLLFCCLFRNFSVCENSSGCSVSVLVIRKYSSSSSSKGKAVPLHAWSGAQGSRKLRFPDYMTTAQDGGKIVSFTHRPPLPPGNAPGTPFS
jgi:hypothetical protein